MERIKLSKSEKKSFYIVCNNQINESVLSSEYFVDAIQVLEDKSLVKGFWIEGHSLEAVRVTSKGKRYLHENPKLRNPVDWKWIINTVVSAVAAITAIIALLASN